MGNKRGNLGEKRLRVKDDLTPRQKRVDVSILLYQMEKAFLLSSG